MWRALTGGGAVGGRDENHGYTSFAPLLATTGQEDREEQASAELVHIPAVPQRDDVLKWLRECSEEDAAKVVSSLKQERPQVFTRAAAAGVGGAKQNPRSSKQSYDVTDINSMVVNVCSSDERDRHAVSSTGDVDTDFDDFAEASEIPTVQFSSAVTHSMEDEEHVVVEVMRIGGPGDCRSEVRYATEDVTAKAGENYKATDGTVVFEPGDLKQEIFVPLMSNSYWSGPLHFSVVLKQEGKVSAKLNRYLCKTSVKLLNDDAFPTNTYAERVASRQMDDVPYHGLLIEYFRMNWKNDVVRRGTIMMFLAAQLHNLYYMFMLYVNVYLVQNVLQSGAGLSEKGHELVGLVIAMVLPYTAMHYFDYKQFTWKVAGQSRKTLQANLLRQFLNLDTQTRADVSSGELVMAITRDADIVVRKGYMNTISLGSLVMKLATSVFFQCTAPFVFDMPFVASSFAPLLIYPSVLTLGFVLRSKVTTRALSHRKTAENDLVEEVDLSVMNSALIVDYCRRERAINSFEQRIGCSNQANAHSLQVLLNNAYIANWVSTLLVALYIAVGGMQVLRGDLSLGLFLTSVHLFRGVGMACGSIHQLILQMEEAIPALNTIVVLLNVPTNLRQRMLRERANIDASNKMRLELYHSRKETSIDVLPIRVVDLKFAYCLTADTPERPRRSFNFAGTVLIHQGNLVCITGPRNKGKSTFLKALAGVHFAGAEEQGGSIFVPSHLRLVHIDFEPMFIRGSLFENLVYGVQPSTDDGNPERVIKICRRLSVPEAIISLLEGEGDKKGTTEWGDVLSQTQRFLLSMVRALVANPDLLCLHKPLMGYNEKDAEMVLQTLHEFVHNRGVEEDPNQKHTRNAKTCIMTSNKELGISYAHQVFRVSDEGICQYSAAQARNSVTTFNTGGLE